MSKWISLKDRLPKIEHEKDGGVNCVLIYRKDGFDSGLDIQIWNTVYLHNHNCAFTHWMPLPKPPKEKK